MSDIDAEEEYASLSIDPENESWDPEDGTGYGTEEPEDGKWESDKATDNPEAFPEDEYSPVPAYDESLPDSDYSREGVTGQVTAYTYTDIELPYLLITDLDSLSISYKLDLVNKLVKPIAGIDQNISVYIKTKNDEWYGIGKIAPAQVKTFLQVVGLENAEARIALPNQPEGRLLTGHLLYALSQ